MTVAFGISFGNTNTVLAARQAPGQACSVEIVPFTTTVSQSGSQTVFVTRSIVHYAAGTSSLPLIGAEVDQGKSLDHLRTMESFKKYLTYTHGHEIDGNIVSFSDAAKGFFTKLVRRCRDKKIIPTTAPLAVAVPIATFDDYSKWIHDICYAEGFKKTCFVDEPSAILLSFKEKAADGDLVMICDFGATSLDLSIVQFKAEPSEVKRGKNCVLIAHTSIELAGNAFDDWLQSRFLRETKIAIDKQKKLHLLSLCRAAKHELSRSDTAIVHFEGHELTFTQSELEQILSRNGLLSKLAMSIDRLIDTAAHDFGFEEHQLKRVYLIGGASNTLALKNLLSQRFQNKMIHSENSLDALARGAASFAAGVDVFSQIQHDYAIYHFDSSSEKYKYDIIVNRGTEYPSRKVLATRTVTAITYNQSVFELIVCELEAFENDEGKIQYKSRFLNKEAPFLVTLKHPIQKGCSAFKVDFLVDDDKQLVINTYNFNARGAMESDLEQRPIAKLS